MILDKLLKEFPLKLTDRTGKNFYLFINADTKVPNSMWICYKSKGDSDTDDIVVGSTWLSLDEDITYKLEELKDSLVHYGMYQLKVKQPILLSIEGSNNNEK